MSKKSLMSPVTLNTILNTAPMILQGASKLIQMIRNRDNGENSSNNTIPVTTEGLKQEIDRLDQRLDANAESDVEQIRLIEQLARHNEIMAESLKRALRHLKIIASISLIALFVACIALFSLLV